ncbi:flagellar basal body-associated FliL family protein [Bowmanella pacifica]|uniref:Flagellar protein FliL n=1 Tax=Bowmanella pacifica TaxID=502051 RepID=A0A917YY31_9ALTE|nr:flagellar basal body-associated FliL family protein [Bowmanella pacifica]GGO69352.1 hypothetical protein GCM10010982_20310 [Bowmanella pacifica]
MKTLVAIIVGAALLGGGVAAGIAYGGKSEEVPTPTLQNHFLPMERFIVSVGNEGYSRYLVLDLSLVTQDGTYLPVLEQLSPVLRNVLVQHFAKVDRTSAKQMFEDVSVVQAELLDKFNQVLGDQGVTSKLEQVLITNVFIQ